MIPHRNGKWHNVEINTILPGSDDEVLFALRDIKAGEKLYTSYTECTFEDCRGMKYHYITPNFLEDYGFVEDYPRRWRLNNRKELVAQVDKNETSGELSLSWPIGELPDVEDLTWIQSQLRRLNRLENEIKGIAASFKSTREKDVVTQYFDGYKELLELAFVYREVGQPIPAEYDALTGPKGIAIEGRNIGVCDRDPTHSRVTDKYTTESQYQEIAFRHSEDTDNTCMYLSDWLQTCSNVRPHYHEAFVHVAGQYVDKVKRVVYLGGGDNMILHEILKFPDVELVVGMELDQQVCRSAFQSMGTLPYFDDPRVQWWFGDATKSLFALPESYFGSFDLVLVDLQTFVADALKVTDKLSIMDTAILLMKQEGGVIAKNEDFSVRTNVGFAKYTVDLEYHDLPKFCQQSITLGSNSVDFMKAQPKSNGVETLAVDLVGSNSWDPHHAWFGYRQSVPNGCFVKHAAETAMECTSEELGSRAGVVLILEAEKISSSLDSISAVKTKISDSIKELGLSEISVSTSADIDHKVLVFVLKEGYVTVRVFAEQKYIAFDIHLWDSIDLIDSLKVALISGVGADTNTFTSFRFVTSGMFGLQSCPKDVLTGIAVDVQNEICSNNTFSPSVNTTNKVSANAFILQEFLTAMLPLVTENPIPRVVGVVCGENSVSCESVSTIQKLDPAVDVVTILGCESFDDMHDCESRIKKQIEAGRGEKGKMDALVLDEKMPFPMAQIIERLFSDKVFHHKMMNWSHIVISPVPSQQEWRSVLVDRFRTDVVLFDPAYRVDLYTSRDEPRSDESASEWCLFSAGDSQFFNRLAACIGAIEASTGQNVQVQEVSNGLINLIADFNPSFVAKNSDYDKSRALSQWHSQTAVGHQTLYQMMVQPPKAMVKEEEIVLVELEEGPWDMVFGRAVVLSECSSSGDRCVVELESKKKPRSVKRAQIRKFSKIDTDPARAFEIGDLVLHEYEEGMYENGVVSRAEEDGTYDIYLLNPDGLKVHAVPATNLILQFESTEFVTEVPALSSTELIGALGYSINSALLKEGESISLINPYTVGSGALFTAFWTSGHVILKWDGQKRVEINLFTYTERMEERRRFQDAFVSQLDHIVTLARDEHPRGYGSIVNFASEMQTTPFWMKD